MQKEIKKREMPTSRKHNKVRWGIHILYMVLKCGDPGRPKEWIWAARPRSRRRTSSPWNRRRLASVGHDLIHQVMYSYRLWNKLRPSCMKQLVPVIDETIQDLHPWNRLRFSFMEANQTFIQEPSDPPPGWNPSSAMGINPPPKAGNKFMYKKAIKLAMASVRQCSQCTPSRRAYWSCRPTSRPRPQYFSYVYIIYLYIYKCIHVKYLKSCVYTYIFFECIHKYIYIYIYIHTLVRCDANVEKLHGGMFQE